MLDRKLCVSTHLRMILYCDQSSVQDSGLAFSYRIEIAQVPNSLDDCIKHLGWDYVCCGDICVCIAANLFDQPCQISHWCLCQTLFPKIVSFIHFLPMLLEKRIAFDYVGDVIGRHAGKHWTQGVLWGMSAEYSVVHLFGVTFVKLAFAWAFFCMFFQCVFMIPSLATIARPVICWSIVVGRTSMFNYQVPLAKSENFLVVDKGCFFSYRIK